jgi:alpha-amylase
MSSVCFYFQVHQPFRLKRYRVFDIGNDSEYFNDDSHTSLNNRKILEKVATKCYLPANAVMLELLEKHPEFKISFSFSGVFLEQLEIYSPETLESFQRLVNTGRVEILSETYYHSLSFLYSKDEFKKQVEMHKKKIKELFGAVPKVFRNTELIYNNELANVIEEMGYKGILAEGADHVLGWQSPNFLYRPKGTKELKLLLKNYKLSDDIAFRFSSKEWSEYPLTAPKFATWVNQANGNGDVVNLFMDYETFGEHQWEDTGIFDFLRAMPGEILKHPDNNFLTPSEVVEKYQTVSELDVHNFMSWADVERDLSAWLSNSMQGEASRKLYDLESSVLAINNQKLTDDWRKLQTSDHFYYMCTKWFNDGDVHKYFNPYESPYEAFISFMNVLNDMNLRIASCEI